MKNISQVAITIPLLMLLTTCNSQNAIDIKWHFKVKEKLLYACKYTMINKSSSDDAPQIVFDGFATVVPKSDGTSLLVFSHDAECKEMASRAVMNQYGEISSPERFNFLNYLLFPARREHLRENVSSEINMSIPIKWFDNPTSISGKITLTPESLQDHQVILQSDFVLDQVAQIEESKLEYQGMLKGSGTYTYDLSNSRFKHVEINLEMALDESSSHLASPQTEEKTTMHFSGAKSQASYEIVLDFLRIK